MNFRNENDISAKCSSPISIGVEILVPITIREEITFRTIHPLLVICRHNVFILTKDK